MLSKHEAHVIRHHVEWLAASRESSVSFTPVNALDAIAAGASQFVLQCNPTSSR